ncbi:RDD family protein [Tessaracoccus sp. OH4464_COT-324]|uniref:RDD family protein n=1 Tax=Tessaracoccus sp. OH4464_COT-324 TaxID=2491059 RepID=UPI001F455F33|nr:RDD family protein [Tessaracoccus sp. OH4464_COT-324]
MIPKGHEVAGLGRRFAAYVLDLAPVLVLELVLFGVLQVWASPAVLLVVGIVSVMLSLAYGLYQWWAYATTGAGLGARLVGVELVGLVDGKPLGWWRVFLRFLVFVGLGATGVGGIAMLIFLVVHERRQGWHDMAVKAIVVQPKAATEHERAEHSPKRNHVRTVGMPPHLAQQFSPEAQPQMTSEYTTQSSFAPQAEQPFFPGPGGFSQPMEPANTFPPAQPGFGGAGTFPPAQSGGFGASSFPAPQPSAPSVGSSFPAPQPSAPSVGSSFPAPQWVRLSRRRSRAPTSGTSPPSRCPPSAPAAAIPTGSRCRHRPPSWSRPTAR